MCPLLIVTMVPRKLDIMYSLHPRHDLTPYVEATAGIIWLVPSAVVSTDYIASYIESWYNI